MKDYIGSELYLRSLFLKKNTWHTCKTYNWLHIFLYVSTFHSRERNRMHARKTRERKKQQSNTLQTRITELQTEVS